MATCKVCGKTNSDDARYCFGCGALLTLAPPIKVDVKSPLTPSLKPTPAAPTSAPIYTPRQLPRQGSCYYHSELPSSYICSRCGRPICAACNRQYGVLSLCTECYWGLAPKFSFPGQGQYPMSQYPVESQQRERSPFSLF